MPVARLTTLLVATACALAAIPGQAAPADSQRTASWFKAHQERTPMLRQFVQRMPKGADLHSHISGAVYAESYLQWAAAANYCVDAQKLAFIAPPCVESDSQPLVAKLPSNTYAALVDHMSMRNLATSGRSGHDQFFDTFAVFGPVSGLPDRLVSMMAELADRAGSQNILHLELMATFQGSAVRKIASQLPWAEETDFARRRQWLLDHGLMDAVQAARSDLDHLDQTYLATQRCGTADARPGCKVSVRWLQQTTRTAAPELVFAQLAYAFELAKADPRVVGLNLVAPEDNPVALRDYRLQMEMIGYLSKQSPEVRIALHAGELVLGLVPPEQLRTHIRDAVLVAGAHRIGHAVDIGHEDDANATLQTMKKRGVAAEICLTSNDVILGVKGRDHPLPDYLAAGVPVVLASDDEGVSRIDLSNEYLRAAQTYGMSYPQLKQLSRNSLEYSFLPGASLWQDAGRARPAAACRNDRIGTDKPSAACQAHLAGSQRASRQWALEAAFDAFEKLPDWKITRR
ncbi:MAG: hypothetical protein RLY71_653 [Pseudomonadota bacterium]|jgi:adenosine deaminase/adenosine deaminase CECR1